MKAWTHDEYGTADVLEMREVATPALEPDRVLVRVVAASVNPYDWHMMTGSPYLVRMQEGLRRPKVAAPGVDFAGVVAAVGDEVTDLAPGDEVFGETAGAFAEHVRAKASSVARKPEGVSFEDAAAVPMAALTALQGLRDKGGLQQGHRVLINGASGGVGTLAVQIAKAYGAEITAVCSSRNIDMVRALGADRVIDYSIEDFTRSGRYDVVFDAVGTRSVLACRRTIAPGGVYVAASAPKSTLGAIGRVLRILALSALGRRKMTTMLARMRKDDLDEIADLMAAGKVTPVIEQRFAFQDVPEALAEQGRGHARGKTVIVM